MFQFSVFVTFEFSFEETQYWTAVFYILTKRFFPYIRGGKGQSMKVACQRHEESDNQGRRCWQSEERSEPRNKGNRAGI